MLLVFPKLHLFLWEEVFLLVDVITRDGHGHGRFRVDVRGRIPPSLQKGRRETSSE